MSRLASQGRNLFLGCGLCLSVLYGSIVAFAVQTPKRSVWDGVYTDAQASRGETQFGRYCEDCHKADLGGDEPAEVPALVLDTFIAKWSGRSVKDLFALVSMSMPHDKPGSLTARTYIDVIAYILQANKFPAGEKELDRDPAQLEQIVIERSSKK